MTDNQDRPDEVRDHQGDGPSVNDPLKPANVPVFNCIVHISPNADGGVRARVVNLSGFDCVAPSERQALAEIVPAFKQRIAELMQSETPIPWIEPPPQAQPGEHTRLIPVHL